MRRTCVFFHAHPDDEALLTAGTMARLAAEGHRAVVVFATAGELGLAGGGAKGRELGAVRMAEARAAARELGCAEVLLLGYADSGWSSSVGADRRSRFSTADVGQVATRLAGILRSRGADLLTVYDPGGGYGHPDHMQVHRVGYRAAALAGTPIVLEATMDRDRLVRAAALLSVGSAARVPWLPRVTRGQFDSAFSPRAEITHRVDVRQWCPAKRAALAAHASQTTGGENTRTVAALLRLPDRMFRWALGTEFYIRRGLPPRTALAHPLAGID